MIVVGENSEVVIIYPDECITEKISIPQTSYKCGPLKATNCLFFCLAGKPIILITTYSNRDVNLWRERSSMKLKEGRNTNSMARKPNHGECCEDTSQQWPYSYFEGVQMPSTCHCAMTSNSNNPFQAASEKKKTLVGGVLESPMPRIPGFLVTSHQSKIPLSSRGSRWEWCRNSGVSPDKTPTFVRQYEQSRQ